jgi:hypothetical protein
MHVVALSIRMPDWAIFAVGAVIAVVILALGYWLLGGSSSSKEEEPETPSWHQAPILRTFERPIHRGGGGGGSGGGGDGDGRDKRATMRRSGHYVDVLVSDAELVQAPLHAMVIDRSMRGLCIAVETGYDKGSVLNVKPTKAPSSVPWVRIVVKNCRNVGNAFEIGCEFVQVPPASILMLFG